MEMENIAPAHRSVPNYVPVLEKRKALGAVDGGQQTGKK